MTEFIHPSDVFRQPSPRELITVVKGLGMQDDEDESLVPLAGGHHNAVYRYGNLVLRHPKTAEGIGAMRAEFDLLVKLDGRRLPRAVDYTVVEGTPVALIEFVDGVHKDFNELTPTEIEELARAMFDLHSLTSDYFSNNSGSEPTSSGTHGDYLRAMIHESVIDRFHELEAGGCDLSAYGEAVEAIILGMQKLDEVLITHPGDFSGRKFCLLHHDLNPENVIWKPDGSVAFIDPNPTYGDPIDDANYAVTNNHGSDDFQRALLQAYSRIAGCGEISEARMQAYTLKNWLDDLAWTIAMCEQHKNDVDRMAYNEYVRAYSTRLAALRGIIETITPFESH